MVCGRITALAGAVCGRMIGPMARGRERPAGRHDRSCFDSLLGVIAVDAVAAAGQSLAPYVPTPADVVDRMLASWPGRPSDDVVYDLGCGDGRIPIAAAKTYGARGVGIDIDPRRIEESRANAKAAGVEHLVEFRLGDVLAADVSPQRSSRSTCWGRATRRCARC